jgi:two-component system chemotaxis response regulator CheB
MLDDGTAGLWLIKDRGGIAIIQEPEEALCPSMRQSALSQVRVDYRLPLSDIAQTSVRIIGGSPLYDTEPSPISRQSEMLEG